jgi:hypothetical protein
MKRSRATRLQSLPKHKADFIEPMECALVPKLPEGPQWTYEVKLDGYRAIGVKTSREAILYSRNGKNFSKRYLYAKLKPFITNKCPFVNLPETGRARWGEDFRRREDEEMRLGASEAGSRG